MAQKAGKGKANCPYNAETQEGQAWLRGYHGMSDPFANDIDEDRVDELSKDKVTDYFSKAAADRGRAEKRAVKTGDNSQLGRRDRGLSMAFKKMREDVELAEGVKLPDGALDKIFSELRTLADDAIANPKKHGIDHPIGQDDTDEENMNFMKDLSSLLVGELQTSLRELGYGELGIEYDDTYNSSQTRNEDEEVLGGDQGQDLINDTKVDYEVDEAREPMYHSVFTQNDDGTWGHYFDADDKIDADEEKSSLRNQGYKVVVIKVPRDQANWGQGPGQVDPNEFVQSKYAASKKPAMQGVDEDANGNEAYEAGKAAKAAGKPDNHSYHPESHSARMWRRGYQGRDNPYAVAEQNTGDDVFREELATLMKNALFRL
jgi:hypothetical protein